jgi:beta-glucosidase/6-phospho-beta-glucosidase/beta-galactosidase
VTAWTKLDEPLLHIRRVPGHPFTDPLLRGRYPDEILRMPGVADDVISDGDLAVISAPLDFYGVSFYHPTVVAAAHGNSSVPFTLEDIPGVPFSDSRWPVQPASLTRALMDLTADYPSLLPLYVAANSCAYQDVENQIGGSVIDAKRTDDVERSTWTISWPRSPMPWDR